MAADHRLVPASLGRALDRVRTLVSRVFSLLPAPLEPRWIRPSRNVMFGPAVWFSGVFLAATVAAAMPGASKAATGHGQSYAPPTAGVLLREAGLWTGFAAFTLLFLILAAGRAAVIGPVRPFAVTARAAVAVFALANTSTVVLDFLFALAAHFAPHMARYTSANPTSGGPYLAEGVLSVAAGISEEIMAVACPVVFVLAMCPRIGRRGLTLLVVLLAAVRLAYHSEYGVLTGVLLPWSLLVIVIFIRSRALVAMMIAHTVYDVMVDSTVPLRAYAGTAAAWGFELGLCALSWWACLRWTTPGRQSAEGVEAAPVALTG